MNCLYCGEKLGLFARKFCNSKHQELFRQREAELAIQRLKDPFGTGETQVAKPKTAKQPPESSNQPPASVVATYEEAAAPTRREPSPETAPAGYGGLQEDKPNQRPASPDAVPDPVVSVKVSGNNTAPPLAGFVPVSELRPVHRLQVFTRRPEAVKSNDGRELDHRGLDGVLTRLLGERGAEIGFTQVLRYPSIPACEPEHYTRRLFVGFPDSMLACHLPIGARRSDFPTFEAASTMPVPEFAPSPEVRSAEPSKRAETEPQASAASETAGPLPLRFSSPTPALALGTLQRATCRAFSDSEFQLLPTAQNTAAMAMQAAASLPAVRLPASKLVGTSQRSGERKLSFQARALPARTPADVPATAKEESQNLPVRSRGTGQILPLPISRRGTSGKWKLAAQHAEIAAATLSSPTSASRQTAFHRPEVAAALSFSGRPNPALFNSGFQRLAPLSGAAMVPLPTSGAHAAGATQPNLSGTLSLQPHYTSFQIGGAPIPTRLNPVLLNSGFQQLAPISSAASLPVPTSGARAAWATQPNLSGTLSVRPRMASFQNGGASIPTLATPDLAPHPAEASRTKCTSSKARHELGPLTISPRKVVSLPVSARFPDVSVMGGGFVSNALPQPAWHGKAARNLIAARASLGPALTNAGFARPAMGLQFASPAQAAGSYPDLIRPSRVPQLGVYGASAIAFEPSPMQLSPRASTPRPVSTKYAQRIKTIATRHTPGTPRPVRYAKAPRSLSITVGRATRPLSMAAFQNLTAVKDAYETRAIPATAAAASLPHRRFACSALPIDVRTILPRIWKQQGATLASTTFARAPQSRLELDVTSAVNYVLGPLPVHPRRAIRKRPSTNLFHWAQNLPAMAQADLPGLLPLLPQRADCPPTAKVLGVPIATHEQQAFSSDTFLELEIEQAKAVAQLRSVQPAEPRAAAAPFHTSRRIFKPQTWTLVAAAFAAPEIAPERKVQRRRAFVMCDTVRSVGPFAVKPRHVERKSAFAEYRVALPEDMIHISFPEPRSALYSTATRALRAAIGRIESLLLANCGFEQIAGPYTAALARPGKAALWDFCAANVVLPNRARNLQFAGGGYDWEESYAWPDSMLASRAPEFALSERERLLACPFRSSPSRDTKPPKWDQFSLPELFEPSMELMPEEPIAEDLFLFLASGLQTESAAIAVPAIVAGISSLVQPRPESADQILDVLERLSATPKPAATAPEPSKVSPAVAFQPSAPAFKEAWAEGRLSIVEVRTEAAPTALTEELDPEKLGPEELARALASLGAGKGANSGFKWTASKVPFIPMS